MSGLASYPGGVFGAVQPIFDEGLSRFIEVPDGFPGQFHVFESDTRLAVFEVVGDPVARRDAFERLSVTIDALGANGFVYVTTGTWAQTDTPADPDGHAASVDAPLMGGFSAWAVAASEAMSVTLLALYEVDPQRGIHIVRHERIESDGAMSFELQPILDLFV